MASKSAAELGSLAKLTAVFLFFMGALQIALGEFYIHSVALTANGIDCVGDGMVSVIVWFGLSFLQRPADKKFNYGYYKVENLASIAAAIVMVALSMFIIYKSIIKLQDPAPVDAPLLGLVVAFIAGAIAWGLGYKKIRESRISNLSSARLEAMNTIKDGAASFITVLSLILSSNGFHMADGIAGFVIAAIILTIGFAAIKESGYFLADACDAKCFDRRSFLKSMAEEVKPVKKAEVVGLRRSGPVTFGELEIYVPDGLTVKETESLKHKIIKLIKSKFNDIDQLTISTKPESLLQERQKGE